MKNKIQTINLLRSYALELEMYFPSWWHCYIIYEIFIEDKLFSIRMRTEFQ